MIEGDGYTLTVEHYWSTHYGVSVAGRITWKGPPKDLVIVIHGVPADVRVLGDRFVAYAPTSAPLDITVGTEDDLHPCTVEPIPPRERPHFPQRDLWPVFLEQVNEDSRSVLEIGSRFVDPDSTKIGRRDLFEGPYTGFDYHPGRNVDVVGDAHRLSSYFDESFGAVMSSSVLEHIAMPWLVVREINRVLEMGGLTYHWVPFLWPLHELPWDFYRYTVEGLRALFSAPLGFEVVDAAYSSPVHTYFDRPGRVWAHHHHPLGASFASCSIIARKVDEVGVGVEWDVSLEDITPTVYPRKG